MEGDADDDDDAEVESRSTWSQSSSRMARWKALMFIYLNAASCLNPPVERDGDGGGGT